MVKVVIDEDEYYPFYCVNKDCSGEVDIPDDKLEWIKRVLSENS